MKINENVRIDANSLKAAKVTKKEFFDLMVEKSLDYVKAEFVEWRHKYYKDVKSILTYRGCDKSALADILRGKKFYNRNLFDECLSYLLQMNLKGNVEFDWENYECLRCLYVGENEKLTSEDFDNEEIYMNGPYGLHTSKNGLTYLAFWAGGDWEYPVMSIFYLTPEKEFALYTPLKGNAVNLNTMQPFGNEDDDFDYKKFEDFAEQLIKTTGIEDFRNNAPYEDMCLDDILQTIEVKKS